MSVNKSTLVGPREEKLLSNAKKLKESPPAYFDIEHAPLVPHAKRNSVFSLVSSAKRSTLSFYAHHKKAFRISLAVALVAIIAITAGVLASKRLHHSSSSYSSYTPPQIPLPTTETISALTATECEAGTFIFTQAQDKGTTSLFLQGEFEIYGFVSIDSKTNKTSALRSIPRTQIEPLSNLTLSVGNSTQKWWPPRDNTKLATVSWVDHESERVIIRLFYFTGLSTLNEAIIHLSYGSLASGSWNANNAHRIISHSQLANLSNMSSIAATFVPSLGTRLYYIDANSTAMDPRPTLNEMKLDINGTQWSTPEILAATTNSTDSALTVISQKDEVYVLYANSRGNLEGLGRENGRKGVWTNAIEICTNDYMAQPITRIGTMAAVMPSKQSPDNPGLFTLYYSESDDTSSYNYNNLMTIQVQTSVLPNKVISTSPRPLNGVYSSYAPRRLSPAIAAVTYESSPSDVGKTQVFYIGTSSTEAKWVVKNYTWSSLDPLQGGSTIEVFE